MIKAARVLPNLDEMRATMSAIERQQLPFATALALTRTAKFVQRVEQDEMKRVFDRPKAFTLNALYVKTATKRDQAAEVRVKDESFKSVPPIRWLYSQIHGGPRSLKSHEMLLQRRNILPAGYFAVPGSAARRDASGNMSPGQITQILSALGASRDPLARSTTRSRKRNAAVREIFAISRPDHHLAMGVYQRDGRHVHPLMLFVRTPRYRQRFRFFEIAEQTGRMRFPIEFNLAMRQAVATARTRQWG